MNEIHTSDVKVYLSCRRQWHYNSVLRLGYEPVLPNMNLLLGRLVHEALQKWYAEKQAKPTLEYLDFLWQEQIDHYRELAIGDKFLQLLSDSRELSYAMLRHYILFSRRHDRFDTVSVEWRTTAPLEGVDASVAGRLDVVAMDEHGKCFIMDHKTASRVPTLQDVQIDLQPATYLLLVPEAEYFIFNYMLKREPMIPRTLKNGRLSKAKLSDTTLEIYGARLKQVKQSWDAYPDVRLELRSQENKFFVRHRVPRVPQALETHHANLRAIAKEMLSGDTPIYPSPDRFKCSWCAFREPCSLESSGADPAVLLRANYKRREGWP